MASSAGTVGRLVAVGALGDEDTDWLLLRLVAHAVAVGIVGLGLLMALLHGFVRDYVMGGTPDPRPD